ncbi:MAG: NYN domain-containing protein [Candidatus Thermochlorobacter sp.]
METLSLDSKLLKVGVFYDGGYFAKVSHYYRYYDERRARISFKGLHEFIREKVKEFEKVPDRNFVQIVDAHYFRGRFSAHDAATRGEEQLFNDRLFDDALMYANIVTHYLPIVKSRYTTFEKGIDVWLALEAFELALLKKLSVVVLITGDGDYLPLIRKLNTIGTRVLLLWWDIDFPVSSNEKPIRTNASIINEATYELNMFEACKLTKERRSPLIDNIFIEPIEDDKEGGSIKTHSGDETAIVVSEMPRYGVIPTPETTKFTTNKLRGKVMFIDKERGIGNLIGIDNPEHEMIVFFRDRIIPTDFDEIEKYDIVEYEVGQNAKGILARKVRRID